MSIRTSAVFYFACAVCATGSSEGAQEISNGRVALRAVEDKGAFVGFDLLDWKARTVAAVRLSSGRLIVARSCRVEAGGTALAFTGLAARPGTGLELGDGDSVRVALLPENPLPEVSFDLTVRRYDAAAWKAGVGAEPFHFLAIHIPDAEAWHQRGWLHATPLADRFPLLEDAHVGTPEVSAYKYNRSWSNTPPLGAHPIPIIGLWAPKSRRYAALHFQETRLLANSEKDIATGYRWVEPREGAPLDEGQFVALVYPHGGRGYQDLVFPEAGARIRSRARLLWSATLDPEDDPNHLFWFHLDLPIETTEVPAVPDVSWIPGGIRLRDFQGPPRGGLIGGVEGPFQVPGSKVLGGWTWHNESPTAVAVKRGDAARIAALEREAEALIKYAKRFDVDGEECVFWEKPLEGSWTPEWGGKAATTLHNANGFAAGRLFLGLYRDLGKKEHLPIVDGVLNWAKRIAWTRNEFADVPSSPFAIGGTLSASFCLEYWMAFRDAPDTFHVLRASKARDLAIEFTYRYLVLWPSDNDRDDDLDASFLWEPNGGRDWTGAACANEVFWNLDTLAQVAVQTDDDPSLRWALAGSLSRWHALYQEVWRDGLAAYGGADMTEGLGLYEGNIYGVGARAAYGFAAPLAMCEPVGDSFARVLAGEHGALAFKKGEEAFSISGCRYRHPGDLAFTVEAGRPRFDLSLTVPYVDMSGKPVAVVREGKRTDLKPGEDLIRPPQALWSLYLKDLRSGDRVVVGEGDRGLEIRCPEPLVEEGLARILDEAEARRGFKALRLSLDAAPSRSWDRLDSFAGFPIARRWTFGVPFSPSLKDGKWAAAKPCPIAPAKGATSLFLLYSAGDGPPPAIAYAGGSREERGPDLEALAWRGWPPIQTARLLIGRYPIDPAKEVTGIDPRGRLLVAATALRRPEGETVDAERRTPANLEKAAAAWRRMRLEDEAIAGLRGEVEKLEPGSIAILPPNPGGPAMAFAGRLGLGKRAALLGPEALLDPSFAPEKHPAAIYAGAEDYVHTVRKPGDAAEALVGYVRSGGRLVLLASQPWPLYYATGPGLRRPEPLTERLGLPLSMAIEKAPGEPLSVKLREQAIVRTTRPEFPFPEGDPRLRSIDRGRIQPDARYTPIAAVIGAGGKDFGDAAGLIELPGGGRILYIAAALLRDPVEGPRFLDGAFRFLAATGKR